MDKCRLSIIIPVYNVEEYLDRCLNSVLDQEFTSYEVILVDDGSTDSSPLICDRYSATDPRFRTLHKPNGGVSSARNAGLELAKGEYVMFLDSDDALLPYGLDDMMEVLTGEDMVLAGYATFIGGIHVKTVRPRETQSYKNIEYPQFFQDNIRHNCEMLDAPWAKLFKRKAIGTLRFNEALSYAEDKLFVFTVMSKCSSIRTYAGDVYAYYVRAGSLGSDISSDKHLQQLYVFLPLYSSVLENLVERCPNTPKVLGLYRKDLIGRYICRMLNIYATRKTAMLTSDNISALYKMMAADKALGMFSLRTGQAFNLLLYKIGKPGFTVAVYKVTAFISSIFERKK
jgi:glycosyltransferase involved in cell wall biosynthesis